MYSCSEVGKLMTRIFDFVPNSLLLKTILWVDWNAILILNNDRQYCCSGHHGILLNVFILVLGGGSDLGLTLTLSIQAIHFMELQHLQQQDLDIRLRVWSNHEVREATNITIRNTSQGINNTSVCWRIATWMVARRTTSYATIIAATGTARWIEEGNSPPTKETHSITQCMWVCIDWTVPARCNRIVRPTRI